MEELEKGCKTSHSESKERDEIEAVIYKNTPNHTVKYMLTKLQNINVTEI